MSTSHIKLIIDDKIPYIREAAGSIFPHVEYIAGKDICAENVKDADALIIRTRTLCNQALLQHSKVKFIATATIGYDHIDTQYLATQGIQWTNCPGCNATSVGQYIESCLLLLKRQHLIPQKPVVGIVGVGHVGTQVAEKVKDLGYTILYNDPPKAKTNNEFVFSSLDEIAEQCDVITFHTPLTKEGEYPTYHLADTVFFQKLKKKPIIINAARGGVVDEAALWTAYQSGQVSEFILDTWENEPFISTQMLQHAFIATPHIAGYSADGKSNASRMALTAVCEFFGIEPHFTIQPPSLPQNMIPATNMEERKLQLYNPLNDSIALKTNPESFEKLRGDYPLRREFWE